MDQKWKDFLVNGGIYEKMEISDQNIAEIIELFSDKYSLDAYCPKCNAHSVFLRVENDRDLYIKLIGVDNPLPGGYPETVSSRNIRKLKSLCKEINNSNLEFVCSRDGETTLKFYFRLTDKEIVKIGQYPTPIDISTVIPTKYHKILGKHYREYKKSIELHTCGYFIGAYVYLRRIIEEIVLAAHSRLQSKDGWDEEQYSKSRFSEKVQLVRSELPDFFVTNVVMYGLVSKGIHELSEDECEKMYPVLKASIEFVLDDIIAKKEQEKKRKEAQDAISKYAQEFGNKK